MTTTPTPTPTIDVVRWAQHMGAHSSADLYASVKGYLAMVIDATATVEDLRAHIADLPGLEAHHQALRRAMGDLSALHDTVAGVLETLAESS